MAVTETDLKKLQKQISQLQRQVEQLQSNFKEFERKQAQPVTTNRKPRRGMPERDRAIELLRRSGVTREMTPEEKRLAAEWRALSPEEKDEVNRELHTVHLDPLLSQLIHEMRG